MALPVVPLCYLRLIIKVYLFQKYVCLDFKHIFCISVSAIQQPSFFLTKQILWRVERGVWGGGGGWVQNGIKRSLSSGPLLSFPSSWQKGPTLLRSACQIPTWKAFYGSNVRECGPFDHNVLDIFLALTFPMSKQQP